jgi:integrase
MAGKLGNGEGSIRKRPGEDRWEARYVDVEGNRRSIYGKTRQEVVRRLANARRDREQGLVGLDERQTLGTYLSTWLEKVRHEVEPSSFARYQSEVRLRLLPGLGKLTLARLTSQQVQTCYAKTLSERSSASVVKYMHGVLRHALGDALRLGLIHRNACDLVDVPRVRRREIMPLTAKQARTFLSSIHGHRSEALYILALATGMRRGELLALRWQHIDLDNALLTVQSSLQVRRGRWVVAAPKTKNSRRTIALSRTTVEALKRHRILMAEERLRLGPAWEDDELVFPNTAGRMQDPTYLAIYQFKPLLRKAGLPAIRFHDLRHTAATLLLAQGVNPKVVSELLGHASIALTLGIYGHVMPHMQQQAAEIMDRLLWGSQTA